MFDTALQRHSDPFFRSLREKDKDKDKDKDEKSTRKESKTSKQRTSLRSESSGEEPSDLPAAESASESTESKEQAADDTDSERASREVTDFPQLNSDETPSQADAPHSNDNAGPGPTSTSATPKGLAPTVVAGDGNSCGFNIVTEVTENIEEELDILCGLYDKVGGGCLLLLQLYSSRTHVFASIHSVFRF